MAPNLSRSNKLLLGQAMVTNAKAKSRTPSLVEHLRSVRVSFHQDHHVDKNPHTPELLDLSKGHRFLDSATSLMWRHSYHLP